MTLRTSKPALWDAAQASDACESPLDRAGTSVRKGPPMSAPGWLHVQSGGRRQVFELHGRDTLGRAPDNTIVLENDDVSRRQCTISWSDDEGWVLEPISDAIPTCLNGQPVCGRATLQHGDAIQIGASTLLGFRSLPPSPVLSVEEAEGFLVVTPMLDGMPVAVSRVAGAWRSAVREEPSDVADLVSARALDDIVAVPRERRGPWALFVDDVDGVDTSSIATIVRGGGRRTPSSLILSVRLDQLRVLEAGLVVRKSRCLFSGGLFLLEPRQTTESWEAVAGRMVESLERSLGERAGLRHALATGPAALRDVVSLWLEQEGGRPTREHVRRLLASLAPERVQAHTEFVEELGVLGVEGLLRLIPAVR